MSALSPGISSSRSRLCRQAAMFWLLRCIAAVNVLALVGRVRLSALARLTRPVLGIPH